VPAPRFLFTPAPGGVLLLSVVRDLARLAALADDGDRLADGHLALRDRDLQQNARGVGLDLLRHLLGVELVERLALLDLVALGLEPPDDRSRLHALPETRELDLSCHCAPRCGESPRARRPSGARRTPP